MSLENPDTNKDQMPAGTNPEQEIVRTPFSSTEELEKFDAKGSPRKDWIIPNTGMHFYGSNEEYAQKMEEDREEQK